MWAVRRVHVKNSGSHFRTFALEAFGARLRKAGKQLNNNILRDTQKTSVQQLNWSIAVGIRPTQMQERISTLSQSAGHQDVFGGVWVPCLSAKTLSLAEYANGRLT
jgi:hypothetical protein